MQLSPTGLNICIDFSSLATYVSLPATVRLLRETQVPVTWWPLIKEVTTQRTASADDPQAEYKARRARAKAMFARAELKRNCALAGIPVSQGEPVFPDGVGQTDAAIGLLWLQQQKANPESVLAYVDSVFGMVFGARSESRNQPPANDFSKLLSDAGVTIDGLAAFRAENPFAVVATMLAEAALFDSPGYVFAGERFMGRQHLPLLRWLIEGRQGIAPV